jgi:hypothetical protein
MKIKIHCESCKDETVLLAEKILTLVQAKEVVKSLVEVIDRHKRHPNDLDFWVYENDDDLNVKRYVYSTLYDKIGKSHENPLLYSEKENEPKL